MKYVPSKRLQIAVEKVIKMNFLSAHPGIDVFGFTITYYAICIMCGMLLAAGLSALLMKRRGLDPSLVLILFAFCIPSAMFCARTYYCITDGMPFKEWYSFTSIRQGGLSILGGIIGGVIAGLIVCLVKKIYFLKITDCVVINILIAQAIGRWGNYFNGEVYGQEIIDSSLQWFPLAVNVNGKWYQALFFYESCINAVGFALLFTAAWFYRKKPYGIFTFAYFLWYGLVRTIMEPMRSPEYILGGTDIMWSRITSILMIILGVCGIVCVFIINVKKEGKLFGTKNSEGENNESG